jgi:HEAT repeat protein
MLFPPMPDPKSGAPKRQAGDSSPAARNLAEWFRQLDRYVRMARTFGPAAPNSVVARERVLEELLGILKYHAPIVLHCTPLEIWLRDEAVMKPPAAGSAEAGGNIEARIPFLLYRDGIRSLTFTPATRREDVAALLDALARVTTSQLTNEDLVTLLWEADLQGLRVDIAPVEQSLRIRSFPGRPGGAPGDEAAADALAWLSGPASEAAPHAGAERAGGRRDEPAAETREARPAATFDDWPVPEQSGDPVAAWRELAADEAQSRADFKAAWARAHAVPWTAQVPALVREVLALDAGPDTADALAHALITWLGSAIQRCEWGEAGQAVAALQGVDADGARAATALTSVLQSIDAAWLAERLDESEPSAQASFFALAVRLGRPALDLVVGVLALATRVRLRAAATTALAYLCADQPRMLAPYLSDSRWFLVRNVVFVLGQIGGDEVAGLLAGAAHNPDVRVRRAVVHALGQAPREQRLPLLVALLESADSQTISAALAMLARETDARVTNALLERVTALDFDTRPDEVKFALIGALGEAAGDDVVPALEQMLQKGGWFARRTAERTAAAQTLARMGTPVAMAVLQEGLQSRAEAIRSACQEALVRRGRAA